jgi:hypothetical protein
MKEQPSFNLMPTKIVKVRIGQSVYEKTVEVQEAPKTPKKKKPEPQMEPVCPMPEPAPQKSFLESAVEAVDEVVRPKAKRGRKPKSSSD